MQPERFTLQLSNERMFLVWIRTATVLMGLGYAVARCALYVDQDAYGAGQRASASYLGGLAMLLGGLAALLASASRYRATARSIERAAGRPPPTGHELRHDNERTLAAWIRTAAALFAFGCAIAQVGLYLELHAITPETEVGMYGTASILVIVALATVLLGLDDYHRRRIALGHVWQRARAHEDELARSSALGPLAILVGIAGASLFGILVVLR